ncbi:outer membrane beta-barrel protein [Nitrospira sp. M1]
MKKVMMLFGLCVIGFSASIAFAEESSDFARKGFYIGAGGIYAIEKFNRTGPLSFDDVAGFNLRAGYRLHPHIAIEAQGERTTGFGVKQFKGDIETWTATLNSKFFALTGRVQPYGLLGVGAMNATTDGFLVFADSNGRPSRNETDVVFRYGGGVDFYLTENWVIDIEGAYVDPRGDINFINYISVGGGLQYRF